MTFHSDNEIIEEIRYRNDIEDVISSYVTLKRAGSNMQGLCPFHSEKTPSFTVFSASKSFFCFGCEAGGDVITFIMRIENLDFPSALEFLAKRAGIPYDRNGPESSDGISRTRIFEMNREAAKFFHEALKRTPAAMDYLSGRGLSPLIIKRFGLGYAPNEFTSLTRHLMGLGYTEKELNAGFLCGVSKKNGKPYDYFRGRIMFPIIDVSGNVIAFGGRVTDASLPKYLNSSDTPAFKKSRNLFALNFAKNHGAKAGYLILCEGYMDVIALHAAGFETAVATLGTAITGEQARLIKKYTNSVIICYDSDEAGQRASEKAFRLLEEAGLQTKILQMDRQAAKDPDEYIKKFGADKFKYLLEGSVSRFDFELEGILKRHDITQTEEKIRAADSTAQFISRVYSAVERDVYIEKAALRLEIPAESLRRDVQRKIKQNIKTAETEGRTQLFRESAGIGDRINADAMKNIGGAKAEEVILGMLLLYPEYVSFIKKGEIPLFPEDFVTELGRRIFSAVWENSEGNGAFDSGILGAHFSPEEMGRIEKIKLSRINLSNNQQIFCDAIDKLKEQNKKEKGIEEILNGKRSKIAKKS